MSETRLVNAAAPLPQELPEAQSFSSTLRELAHLELAEHEAEYLLRNVAQHRRALLHRLGRDVGQEVALLDYIVNIRPSLVEPRIIQRTTLENIEQQALVDGLTGLRNRNVLDLEIEREVQRALRYNMPLALMVLDLDGFKAVNDTHGHQVGDLVLARVGALIQQHVRSADVACRLGGDEFAMILPDTTFEVATAVAVRMCAELTAWFALNDINGLQLDLHASGGVASLLPGQGARDLMNAADAMLYESKRAGGGRIGPSLDAFAGSRPAGIVL